MVAPFSYTDPDKIGTGGRGPGGGIPHGGLIPYGDIIPGPG